MPPSLRLDTPRRALSLASGHLTALHRMPTSTPSLHVSTACTMQAPCSASVGSILAHRTPHAATLDGKQALPPASGVKHVRLTPPFFPSLHTHIISMHIPACTPAAPCRAVVGLSPLPPTVHRLHPCKPLPGHHLGLCFYRCGQLRITSIMQNSSENELCPILNGAGRVNRASAAVMKGQLLIEKKQA